MNQIKAYKLGRSIAQIIPSHRQIKDKEIITTKVLIVMAIIAIAKIAVLSILF
jgi:hypothetical protein